MDEQQIRRLVRQALARHLGPPDVPPAPPAAAVTLPAAPAAAAAPYTQATARSEPGAVERHPSALRFVILRAPDETSCIVEPSVACNHCGYCQCFGH